MSEIVRVLKEVSILLANDTTMYVLYVCACVCCALLHGVKIW